MQFDVIYLEEAVKFLESIPRSAFNKVLYNIDKVCNGAIDNELFKKLEGHSDLWEFRTLYNGIQYRLIAFWDAKQKRMVVATHGFTKKTWKIPSKEISKALAIRKAYYEND